MIRLELALTALLAVLARINADAVSPEDITFFLSNNEYSYEQFQTGSYSHLDIDPSNEIKIVCHGWIDSVSTTWYEDAKKEYDIRGGATVIGVDWSPHSTTLYSIAVRRTDSVGYYIARLVVDMSNQLGIPLPKFHLIGHSLGAHISGFAGQHVIAMTGRKVGRITGLDPAGPLFNGNSPDNRLSDDDADFVDIIHTDSGVLGHRRSIGHVDFYPNGGRRQAGCGILITSPCSHNRAPTYYYESINSNGFVAVSCSSQRNYDRGNCNSNPRTVMGEEVDQTQRGDFYLATARSAPFALGE